MKKWNPVILDVELPKNWSYREEEFKTDYVSTSYIRPCKLSPVGNPENLYVVFYEYNPEVPNDYSFAVRGGLHIQPKDAFKKFKSHEFKDAIKYMLFIMNETSSYYSKIESNEALKDYNKKLSALKSK